MRYYELTEDIKEEPIDRQKLIAAESIIKEHCQPYLQAIGGDVHKYPLFRGVKYENDYLIRKPVRLDMRRPQDTDIQIHEVVNEYFDMKLGEPYRNAMFAAGTPHVTLSFGDLYLVFPAGPFTFAWSPEIMDFQSEGHDSRIQDILDGDGDDIYEWDSVESYMDELKYTTKDLTRALTMGNEIMFRCEEYFGIRIASQGGHGANRIDKMTRILTDTLS